MKFDYQLKQMQKDLAYSGERLIVVMIKREQDIQNNVE